MGVETKNIDLGLFAQGDTICVDYIITNDDVNDSGKIAQNVEVTVTVPEGLSILTGTVTQGVFTSGTGIWQVGSLLPCGDATLSLCLTIDDTCNHPYTVDFDFTSDACDCTLSSNFNCAVINGISCCDIANCDLVNVYENVYIIPQEAFGDPLSPELSEVTTWATNNLTTLQREGGSIITYNRNPFEEFNVYNNFVVTVTGLGGVGSLIRFKVNGNFIDEPGTVFDSSDSASFDEAAVKSYLEANITGTATIVDDIDGTGTVTITISSQTGITSFTVVDDASTEFTPATATYTVENNYGRDTNTHVWVTNKTATGFRVTEILRSEDHGDVNYVSTEAQSVTEKGDSHKPYASLAGAVDLPDEGTIHILPGTHVIDTEINLLEADGTINIYAGLGTTIEHNIADEDGVFLVGGDEVVDDEIFNINFKSEGNIKDASGATSSLFKSTKRGLIGDFDFNNVNIESGRLLDIYGKDISINIKDIIAATGRDEILRISNLAASLSEIRNFVKLGRVKFTGDDNIFLNHSTTNASSDSVVHMQIDSIIADGADATLVKSTYSSSYEGDSYLEIKNLVNKSTTASDISNYYDRTIGDSVSLNLSQDLSNGAKSFIKLGSVKSFNIPILHFSNAIEDSTLTIVVDSAIAGDWGLSLDLGLTNSTVIVDANIKCTGDKPAIKITNQSDANSKIIIKGRYEVTGAIPVVAIDEDFDGVVQFEDAVLINDATAAAVVTNAGAPISVIFKNTVTNTAVVDANVTADGDGLSVDPDFI